MSQGVEIVGSGRYRLMERLGGGHTSETFLAVHEQLGTVIVKRFSTRHADSWKRVELAEREALVLQRLNHELLPRYVDHFEEGGALYTVMTRVDGEDLAAARRRGRAFGEGEIVGLLRDGATALGYLHGQLPPLVHRDLKPSNILLGTDGRFRIVDLGAVAELRAEAGSTVVGTFGYMAPEQFQGRASPASDIYSLGATALALLTRTEPEKLPHVGLGVDVRRALGKAVSEPLVRTLEAMLQPDPALRPRDLRRLLERASLPRRSSPAARASAAPAASPARVISPPTGLGPTFAAWPAWKKGAAAAVSVILLGRLARSELLEMFALVLLPLVYVLWSMTGGRSSDRVRTAPHHPRESSERRPHGKSSVQLQEGASSERPANEPPVSATRR